MIANRKFYIRNAFSRIASSNIYVRKAFPRFANRQIYVRNAFPRFENCEIYFSKSVFTMCKPYFYFFSEKRFPDL